MTQNTVYVQKYIRISCYLISNLCHRYKLFQLCEVTTKIISLKKRQFNYLFFLKKGRKEHEVGKKTFVLSVKFISYDMEILGRTSHAEKCP